MVCSALYSMHVVHYSLVTSFPLPVMGNSYNTSGVDKGVYLIIIVHMKSYLQNVLL